MPKLHNTLLHFFMVLAGVGLLLSVVSHAATFFGATGPLGNSTWLLHIGIFLVWIPAFIVAQPLTLGVSRKDFWKAALRGCPGWMKYMVYGFFGYALLNFLSFVAKTPKQEAGGTMPPAVVGGFSGHWMAFYSTALAILYSAARADERDRSRRCPNGHKVGPLAEYCERCGHRVMELPTPPK